MYFALVTRRVATAREPPTEQGLNARCGAGEKSEHRELDSRPPSADVCRKTKAPGPADSGDGLGPARVICTPVPRNPYNPGASHPACPEANLVPVPYSAE